MSAPAASARAVRAGDSAGGGGAVRAAAEAGRSPVAGWLDRASLVDFPGRMAGVLFCAGCNFRCGFCHNARLLGAPRPGAAWDAVDGICARLRTDWADGVVVTGGEPTLSPALPELVDRLRGHGLAVKLDTNGSRPDVLEALLPRLDYVAMDVKCRPERYPERVGFDGVEAIRASIRLLAGSGRPHEFRTTVLPGWHDEEEMAAVAEAVRGAARFVLQPFVPRDDLPEAAFRTLPRPAPAHLQALAAVLRGRLDCVEVRGT